MNAATTWIGALAVSAGLLACSPQAPKPLKPEAAAAPAAVATPAPLQGRWFALSMPAIREFGDIEFRDGRLRTAAGAVAVDLAAPDIAGLTGKAWLAPLDARASQIRPNGWRICGNKPGPEEARWLLVTLDPSPSSPRIDLTFFDTEAPPTDASPSAKGQCNGFRFERSTDDTPLTPPLGEGEITDGR